LEEKNRQTADGLNELSAQVREIFAGDEDFYLGLERDIAGQSIKNDLAAISDSGQTPRKPSRAGLFKKIIVGAICMIFMLLLVPVSIFCLGQVFWPRQEPVSMPARHETRQAKINQPTPVHRNDSAEIALNEPVSWKLAQSLYKQQDWPRASYACRSLISNFRGETGNDAAMRDFLHLRIALCSYKLQEYNAESLFENLLHSPSPAIQALTNYYLAIINYQKKNFPNARMRAYKCLALLDSINSTGNDIISADCHFLIAAALTSEMLPAIRLKTDVPESWPAFSFAEPFDNIDEAGLATVLQGDADPLHSAALGPKAQKLANPDELPAWCVKSSGAGVDEVLAVFTAAGSTEICWGCDYQNTFNRPVTMYLKRTSSARFAEILAGSVGLFAVYETNNKITIRDPESGASLVQRQAMYVAEAAAAWQRASIAYRHDKRCPDARFALGILYRCSDHGPTAITEFRQVVEHFPQSLLAPYALLNSAKARLEIKDFTGAEQDLKDLTIQYPDTQISDTGTVLLASTAMQTGRYDQAQMIYRKVCNLEVSQECKLAATLGAAKSFYAVGDFASAADWFDRYFKLAKTSKSAPSEELQEAHIMLAQCNRRLGNLGSACSEYQTALAGAESTKASFEITLELVNAFKQQDKFVEAMETIERLSATDLTAVQLWTLRLAKAQILRSMHLGDQAQALLESTLPAVNEPTLKSGMILELAYCCIDSEDYDKARELLAKSISGSEAGAKTSALQYELASISLKAGDTSRAIEICNGLLKTAISPQLKNQVLATLAAAYKSRREFDKAAMAFSGAAVK
jgi:tetratricopeptide (TPR) repeat protein